jgi:hypothetical protein
LTADHVEAEEATADCILGHSSASIPGELVLIQSTIDASSFLFCDNGSIVADIGDAAEELENSSYLSYIAIMIIIII